MEVTAKTTMEAWKKGLMSLMDQPIKNLIVRVDNPAIDVEEPVRRLMQSKQAVFPSMEELKSIMLTRKGIPTIPYTYGSRIFNYGQKVNQVKDFVIPALQQDPSSEAAVVVQDPLIDNPQRETPGLTTIFFSIERGMLNITGVLRANDFFIGWPTMAYQLFCLQEYVAKSLALPLGSLTTIIHSAQIMNKQLANDFLRGEDEGDRDPEGRTQEEG